MSTPLRRPRKPNLQESIREELPEIIHPQIIKISNQPTPRKRGRPKLNTIDLEEKGKKENEESKKDVKIEVKNPVTLPDIVKEEKLNEDKDQKLEVIIDEKPKSDDKIDKIVEKLEEIPDEDVSSPKKFKSDSCHIAEKSNVTQEELQLENDKIKRSLRYYRHNKHHQLLRNIIRDSREPINNKDAIFILDLIKCYTR